MPLPSTLIRKSLRNREVNKRNGILPVTSAGCGEFCHSCPCIGTDSYRKYSSVLIATSTLPDKSFLSHYCNDCVFHCEGLWYIIGNAAARLYSSLASMLNCHGSIVVKPMKIERACCVTWGPNEVFHLDEDKEIHVEKPENDLTVTAYEGIVEMRESYLLSNDKGIVHHNAVDTRNANDQSVEDHTGWEKITSQVFEVAYEKAKVSKNDNELAEHNQKIFDASFEANFADFSSFAPTPEVSLDDASVNSLITTATSTASCNKRQKARSCASCGMRSKKGAPIKLKLCSRCKTTYYCSSGCQKVDWDFSHRDKCRAHVLQLL